MKKLALLIVLALFGACGDEPSDSSENMSKNTYGLSACSYVGQTVGNIWIQSYLPEYYPTRFFAKWSCAPATYDPIWAYSNQYVGPSVWTVKCATVGRNPDYTFWPQGQSAKCLGFYYQYSTHDAYLVPSNQCLRFKIESGSVSGNVKLRATNPNIQMQGPYLQTVIFGGSVYWHCNCANCNVYTAHYLKYTPYGSDFVISEL